nr:hypothetical protein [Gammaproteobacteria bacterium]NIN62622.1 hypothetical protein [Gammaproteobacteria bacterium]NIO63159.1 hypothetical protein [Gammaproteobacteria bacterium]NIQ20260.1 hypothetical protein [Gammaproteobacteria bacterium]NIT06451.1 hypothetical protein [Gammaproteobacteria bacterium]
LNGSNTGVANIETIDMNNTGILVGNAVGPTTWTLSGAGSDINGIVTLQNLGTIRSGAGTNTYNSDGTYTGNIQITSLNNTWNHNPNQTLTTGTVSGGGVLTIPGPGLPNNLTVGPGDLVLPDLTGFSGHLLIGGTMTPLSTNIADATFIDVQTNILTVDSPIVTNANVTLLSGELVLNNTLSSGNLLTLVANTGDILVPALVDLSANSGYFIANGDLPDTINMRLLFGGGSVEVATGTATGILLFAPGSNAINVATPSAGFLSTLNALGLSGLVSRTISISNPAAELTRLEELLELDTGLFEQDLTLFGIIGNGIALALAQCEEIDGCAPNITMDELNELIVQLETRLEELKRRCLEFDIKACDLIKSYKEELDNFYTYRDELQQYLASIESIPEELEDEFTKEFGIESGIAVDATVRSLQKTLQTIEARIIWLESLKENPVEQARLGEISGFKITPEVLEEIIEGARTEAKFIEEQILMLLNGTQASNAIDSQPIAATEEANQIDNIGNGVAVLAPEKQPYQSTGLN